MRRLPLEKILEHNGRMDVFCRLLDEGPLMTSQVAAETGEPTKAVRYWLRSLESVGLIKELADPAGGEPLHAASLDVLPEWMRCVIEHSRARHRLGSE